MQLKYIRMKLLNLVISSLFICNIIIGQGIYPNQLAPAPDSNMILKSKGNLLNAFDYEYINAGSGVNPRDSTVLESGHGIYTYEVSPNNWVVEADTNELVTQYDLTQIPDGSPTNELTTYFRQASNPSSWKLGDLWYNPNTGILYIYQGIIKSLWMQPNWSTTNTSDESYIKNKPNISQIISDSLNTIVELDPIFAADSNKIVHWSDTLSNIATQYDLTQIQDNDTQDLSIDSLNRVFTINLTNGGNVKWKDTNSGGTVTSVTASAPVSSSGGNNPNISVDTITNQGLATQFDIKKMVSDSSYWNASGNNIYNANSGNVGIGAASPTAKLEVNGDLKINTTALGTSDTLLIKEGNTVKYRLRSSLPNPIDSTTVVNSYGTIINESPANQWNIKVDSSKFATPYDLSLKGDLWGDGITNYLPIWSGTKSLTFGGGTGFVKVTDGSINYDNSTYLTSEVDGSTSNELQTISTTGAAGNITLSNGGGTLNLNVNDADASPTNELELPSQTGNNGKFLKTDGSTATWQNDNNTTYSAGFGIGLSSTTFFNSRYWKNQDTVKTTLSGILKATSGVLSAASAGTDYQAPLTNPVTGTGTTNYLSKFTGTSSIGSSRMYDNGSEIGIGTTSPTHSFDIRSGSGFRLGSGFKFTIDGGNNAEFSSPGGLYFYGAVPIGSAPSGQSELSVQDGKVGINDQLPDYALDVQGDFRVTSRTGTAATNACFDANGKLVSGGLNTISGNAGYIPYFTNTTDLSQSEIYRRGDATAFSFLSKSTAGYEHGSDNGNSYLFRTPSLNTSFNSGLAISGSYATSQSTINMTAFGVKSGGGYNSKMVLQTTYQSTVNDRLILDNSGVTIPNLTATGYQIVTTNSTGLTGNLSNGTGLLYNNGSGGYTWVTGALPALTDGKIWVGNTLNAASERVLSGDATMDNMGVVTVTNDSHTHSASTIIPDIVSSVENVANDGGNIDLVGDGISITGDDANNNITFAQNQKFLKASANDTTKCGYYAWRKIKFNNEIYDTGPYTVDAGNNTIQVPSIGYYEIETRIKFYNTSNTNESTRTRILVNGEEIAYDGQSYYYIAPNEDLEPKIFKTIVLIQNTSHLITVEVKNSNNNNQYVYTTSYPTIMIKKIANY